MIIADTILRHSQLTCDVRCHKLVLMLLCYAATLTALDVVAVAHLDPVLSTTRVAQKVSRLAARYNRLIGREAEDSTQLSGTARDTERARQTGKRHMRICDHQAGMNGTWPNRLYSRQPRTVGVESSSSMAYLQGDAELDESTLTGSKASSKPVASSTDCNNSMSICGGTASGRSIFLPSVESACTA